MKNRDLEDLIDFEDDNDSYWEPWDSEWTPYYEDEDWYYERD